MRVHQYRYVFVLSVFLLSGSGAIGQRYLSDYDSSFFIEDTVRGFLKRMENLHFSGYIQPQYQLAETNGVESFEGGNFGDAVSNRFILRRARLKIDYRMPGRAGDFPAAVFTFQFEATERDVNVRDMFVRVFEPKNHNFSLTAGLFARPFGYEVNLSSSFRETPERGRASQILMPSERDLGAMVSYESQKEQRKPPLLKFDIGVFNGQGKSGPAEFDSYKDIISRWSLKPMQVSKNFHIAAGLSYLNGGWVQTTKYEYKMSRSSGMKFFAIDSSLSNIGKKAPRKYFGADAQLVLNHAWGKTEWRAEYWKGKQPGTANTTSNPGTVPTEPTYLRNFDAGFFYFLQNIINEQWEFMVKYDWYDPNIRAEGKEIGISNLTPADVRYSTFGFGLTKYFTDKLKVLAYYAIVRNEKTSLNVLTSDISDNVFTLRMQLRF